MRTTFLMLLLSTSALCADENEKDLQRRIEELEKSSAADRRRIAELESNLAARDAGALGSEIDAYLAEAPAVSPPARGLQKYIDISADILVAAGGSTATDPELLVLQGGGHDPRQRGFTLQQLEVSFIGNVDPHLRAEVHVILFLDPEENETEVELEEAFVQTLRLPHGLQIEVGHFFTEFGRHNPQHPHQWQFADSPIVLTRFFGEDGIRAPGVRLAWLLPTDFFLQLHLGMQIADGETMTNFLANQESVDEHPVVQGRPFVDRDVSSLGDFVYLVRIESSFDLSPSWTLLFGGSALFGPNYTGDDGDTAIYGIDLYLKWRPERHDQGWPFLVLQLEFLWRDFDADDFDDGTTALPAETFDDHGFYVQGLYGFKRPWTAGLRVEHSSGNDVVAGDPFRDNRTRISAMVTYHTSEFARLRLQVSYENQNVFSDEAVVSIWLVLEIGIGAHPAHTY